MPVSTVPATRPPRRGVRIPATGRITAFPTASPGGRPGRRSRRIENRHSGKALAVDGTSAENGARVARFADTGTGDHAWQLTKGRADI